MTEHEPLQPLTKSQRVLHEEATATYEEGMTPQAARYLLDRGISQETAMAARLGVVTDPLPGHERMRGFLSIPYLDRHGAPLSVRFRCLEQHDHREHFHGKYMSLPEEPPRLYNIGAIFAAEETIAVTEGEFDALILNQIGIPAVGAPGAKMWRPHHRRMLAGFGKVWVFGDPDEAGAEFSHTVTRSIRQAHAIRLRLGDVTDTYLQGGEDAIYELIEEREQYQ